MVEDLDKNRFFCCAKQLPNPHQVSQVLIKVHDKFVQSLEPEVIANSLIDEKLISIEHKSHICNITFTRQDRTRHLIGYLQMCGDRPEVLMKLYSALLNTSGTPSHLMLARHLRLEALEVCKELPCPVFNTDEANMQRRLTVVKSMTKRIPRIEIERSVALQLERFLGLEKTVTVLNDVSAICLKWIEKKREHCTPQKMVRALILTKGLGRYASMLVCPWVCPFEVRKFLVSCQNKVFEIATFLGFGEIEEGTDIETIVEKLLEEWKIPDFGDHTSQYLKDLKKRVIPECLQLDPVDCQEKGLSQWPAPDKQPGGWPIQFGFLRIWQSDKESHGASFQPATPQKMLTTAAIQTGVPMLTFMHQQVATPPIENATESPIVEEFDHDEEFNDSSHFKEDVIDSLHEAIRKRLKNNLLDLLKNHDKDVNTRGNDGRTPLMFACRMKYIEGIKILLQFKADPNLKDKDGFACLHYREVLESKQIIMLLVKHGQANIDIENDEKMTPFAMVCVYGIKDSIDVLLELNADINGSSSARYTPLSLAIQYGNELTVVSIIQSDEHNVAVNAINKMDGSTALIRACELNQTEIAIKLISSGANVKPQTMNGCTAIFIAAQTNNIELLQLLIIREADLNRPGIVTIRDFTLSLTPLSIAAANGYFTAVEILVKNGADVNFTSSNNNHTPLFWTTLTDQRHIAEYLLKLNETRKDFFALKQVFDLLITQEKYGIGDLILTALGGEEKALQEAKQDCTEMGELVSIVIEGIKEMKKEQRSRQIISSHTTASSASVCVRQEEDTHTKQYLNEFVQYSIETFLLGRNQHEALSDGHMDRSHIEFFRSYFNDRNQPDLFQQFLKGPCAIIFNSRYFTGKRLSTVLNSHNKPNFCVDLPATVLYFALLVPDFQQSDHDNSLDGKQLIKMFFGERFYAEADDNNLFNPTTDTAPDASSPDFRTSRDPVSNTSTSLLRRRVVPANIAWGLPEIYIKSQDYATTSPNFAGIYNEDITSLDESNEVSDEEQDDVKKEMISEGDIDRIFDQQQQLQTDMNEIKLEINHIKLNQKEMLRILNEQTKQLTELTNKNRRSK